MSYEIIRNEKENQFGMVFKFQKKEGCKGIKLNKINCQNNVSTFSFNNNALRFIRLGVDYRNKPLKYLFKGGYNKYKPFHILNQVFLPPIKRYVDIKDCVNEINKIIFETLLSTSVNIEKWIYLDYNTTNSNYSLIINNITGTREIPNLNDAISGINTPMLRFKREFNNYNDICNCLKKDDGFVCLTDKTIELNCYTTTTITTNNFNIISGDNIEEFGGNNTTVIFMNLAKSRLISFSPNDLNSIQLQNNDRLLVIIENNSIITQTLVDITNITSDTNISVIVKPYYQCVNCIICKCANEYKPDVGVYSLEYKITDETTESDLNIYMRNFQTYIKNNNVIFTNYEFELTPESMSNIEYIVKKKNILVCRCGTKIPCYSESYTNNDDPSLFLKTGEYISTVQNNLIQDYVIVGWRIKLNQIQFTENYPNPSTEIPNVPFKYKTKLLNPVDPTNIDSLENKQTFRSSGDIKFMFFDDNPFPSISVKNWKTSEVLFDQLCYNSCLNDDTFMEIDENNNYNFSIKITPIEFTKDLKVDSNFDFKTVSFKSENHHVHGRYYGRLFPNILNYSEKLQFIEKNNFHINEEINNVLMDSPSDCINVENIDYLNYINLYYKTDKFYSLFGQFQESAWYKLGIVSNYINPDLLNYHFNTTDKDKTHLEWYNPLNKITRIYNILGNAFTQELYLSKEIFINQEIYSSEDLVCQKQTRYLNPTTFFEQKYQYNLELIESMDYYKLEQDYLNNSQRSTKIDGSLLTNHFYLLLQPSLNYDNNIYTFRIMFSKYVDYEINTFLNTSEIHKENARYITIEKNDTKFELIFKNLTYRYEEFDEDDIWIYIDSQYHYPFLSHTTAYLEVEYFG